MLPINWLNHRELPDVNVEIVKNSITLTLRQNQFFVEKYFDSCDPKIHGPSNYLLGFYVASLIDKSGTTKHYPLAMFRNGISKRQDHLLQATWTMEFLRHPLILQ